MAGRVGGAGGKDQVSGAHLEETAAVGQGAQTGGAGEVADYSGAPNAKRTARAKSMDMGGLDLVSQLNAKLDAGGPAAQAKKDAQDVIAFTRDISGIVVTAELDARIAQARELLGAGQLDEATENSLQDALATLIETSETQGAGEDMGDQVALIATPEFDEAMEAATAKGGVDEKEAKALQALAEKMVKDAPSPSDMYMALSEKIMQLSMNAEMKGKAGAVLEGAGGQLWATMQKTSMARIDTAVKVLGEKLKAPGALKGPLANVDLKSMKQADAGDSYHLSFKLKNGKPGTFESAEGKALAKLLESDPKLGSVQVGVPKAFIE